MSKENTIVIVLPLAFLVRCYLIEIQWTVLTFDTEFQVLCSQIHYVSWYQCRSAIILNYQIHNGKLIDVIHVWIFSYYYLSLWYNNAPFLGYGRSYFKDCMKFHFQIVDILKEKMYSLDWILGLILLFPLWITSTCVIFNLWYLWYFIQVYNICYGISTFKKRKLFETCIFFIFRVK